MSHAAIHHIVYTFEFFLKWDETVKESSFLRCRVAETCECPGAYQFSSVEEVLFSAPFSLCVQVYYSAFREENQMCFLISGVYKERIVSDLLQTFDSVHLVH